MAITFVPAVMTYLGTKNRFGKKKMALLKINIHKAILDYVKHSIVLNKHTRKEL